MMRTLIPFELKKMLIKKSVFIAFLAALLVLMGLFYINFFNDGQISGSSSDRIHGREAVLIKQKIAEEHTGYLSDQLMERIVNDYAGNISYFKKNDLFDPFSWNAIDRFVPNSQKILPEIFQSERELHYDGIKMKSQEELGSALPLESLKLGNFAPWQKLFSILNTSLSLVLILVIYICSSVFSGDRAKGMNPLILTTKYGRKRLTLAKIGTVFGIGISVFAAVYLTILLVFAFYFGWSGWDTSVQMNLEWISSIYNILEFPVRMNLLELLIRLIAFQFIGFLFILGLTVLVSSLTKSPLTSFATSLGIFLAPDFLLTAFREGVLNKILTILSVSTNGTEGILLKLSSSKGFLFSDFAANGLAIMMIRLLLVMLSCCIVYRILKKQEM